jgi:hypothetical protein
MVDAIVRSSSAPTRFMPLRENRSTVHLSLIPC